MRIQRLKLLYNDKNMDNVIILLEIFGVSEEKEITTHDNESSITTNLKEGKAI